MSTNKNELQARIERNKQFAAVTGAFQKGPVVEIEMESNITNLSDDEDTLVNEINSITRKSAINSYLIGIRMKKIFSDEKSFIEKIETISQKTGYKKASIMRLMSIATNLTLEQVSNYNLTLQDFSSAISISKKEDLPIETVLAKIKENPMGRAGTVEKYRQQIKGNSENKGGKRVPQKGEVLLSIGKYVLLDQTLELFCNKMKLGSIKVPENWVNKTIEIAYIGTYKKGKDHVNSINLFLPEDVP